MFYVRMIPNCTVTIFMNAFLKILICLFIRKCIYVCPLRRLQIVLLLVSTREKMTTIIIFISLKNKFNFNNKHCPLKMHYQID